MQTSATHPQTLEFEDLGEQTKLTQTMRFATSEERDTTMQYGVEEGAKGGFARIDVPPSAATARRVSRRRSHPCRRRSGPRALPLPSIGMRRRIRHEHESCWSGSAGAGDRVEGTGAAGGPVRDRASRGAIYMLCEAAELEHGIMCQYLFAAFSLKQSTTRA